MIFDVNKVHIVGIGGIGVSALARKFLLEGKIVTGSDISNSRVTDELINLGAKISIGHKANNLEDDTDLVIATIAANSQNPELQKAEELKIKILSYPQALGELTKDYKTIAVSGTHGKTTTTAMVADILINAGKSPTVVVGSLLKQTGSNFYNGNGEYLVVEACEYRRSFLNLHPFVLIITNIDLDHLDYYKDLNDIKNAFKEMIKRVSTDGLIIANLKDEIVKEVISIADCRVIDYSEFFNKPFNLSVFGQHNIQNAAAAFAVANFLNISEKEILNSLSTFKGTWRRFEFRGVSTKGFNIYDDYAHHPTEMKATLKAFFENFKDKKVAVVFQPHLFSRTKFFLDEMADVLAMSDLSIILPIYAAREIDSKDISSNDLFELIQKNGGNTVLASNPEQAVDIVNKKCDFSWTLLTMGAGDVYKIGDMLLY